MKILILNGSPRPNGNTAAMVRAYAEGASEAGHTVHIVNVCQKKIAGCLACEYCHTKGGGKCIQQDDMQEVYPLLEEGTKLILDSLEMTPREENAAKYADTWQQVEAPGYPYPERCYFHKLARDAEGMTQYTIFNEKRGIGVNVQYDGSELPFFCEWKMLGKGEYVMGLEPMNVFLDGPKVGQEGCAAPILGPGESKVYKIKLNFIDKL